MSIVLRQYQEVAKKSVFAQFREVNSTLLVMATGLGKTRTGVGIAQSFAPMRILWTAHRGELLMQARNAFMDVGMTCEIEKAEQRVRDGLYGNCQVVCAMVQSLNGKEGMGKRMGRFNPQDFGLVVIDEAHRSVCPSYKNIINYFRQNPDLRILGLTATPKRSDREALGQLFESVAFDYDIGEAIEDGWLVDVEEQMVHIDGLDFSHIRTTAGDLNGADLAAVMESEKTLHGVASATLQIVGTGSRTLVFTVRVEQAQLLAEIFNRHRPGIAQYLDGKTPEEKRAAILAQFANGQLQILVNVGVLTEGYDNPLVETIVMARPTKSHTLFKQMLGRATRPLPGIVDGLASPEERVAAIKASAKRRCLVVDFTGNTGRHRLITCADILGGKVTDRVLDRVMRRIKKLGKPVAVAQLIQQEAEQEKLDAQRREERNKAREERRKLLIAKARFRTQQIDPFSVFGVRRDDEGEHKWVKPLTEGQRGLLRKNNIDPDTLSPRDARRIIGQIAKSWNGGCTVKQATIINGNKDLLLRLHPGLEIDVTKLSKKDASNYLDEIFKARNWDGKGRLHATTSKAEIHQPGTDHQTHRPSQSQRSQASSGSSRPGTTSRSDDSGFGSGIGPRNPADNGEQSPFDEGAGG